MGQREPLCFLFFGDSIAGLSLWKEFLMNNIRQASGSSIRLLAGNPIFLSAVTAFIVSQIIKAVIMLLFSKERKAKEILVTLVWSTGGMPSSHASLVAAMATSTALNEGISSTIFGISLFLALIVMRDALGVRRAAGMQAKALNALSRQISEKLNFSCQQVKEIQGHTPLEVTFGGILGVISALIFWIIRS
jgi:acid phosphatase family membrane protein YuiD